MLGPDPPSSNADLLGGGSTPPSSNRDLLGGGLGCPYLGPPPWKRSVGALVSFAGFACYSFYKSNWIVATIRLVVDDRLLHFAE